MTTAKTRYCAFCGDPLITTGDTLTHRGTGAATCTASGPRPLTEEREQDVLNASIALITWFYGSRLALSPELRSGPFLALLDRADALLEVYDPPGHPGTLTVRRLDT